MLAIFVCFIGAFFGTPPTTIDHRIFAANGGPMERRLLGDLMKSYNKLERPVLLKVSINSKYFLMHHCVFLWESYYLLISFPLDLTEIIESLGVKAFRESTGNGNQKIINAYFAAMVVPMFCYQVICRISSRFPIIMKNRWQMNRTQYNWSLGLHCSRSSTWWVLL